MGVNAYTTNIGIGERLNTYVPLPFQEMYTVLMERQKRYDAADEYEREAKKEISKLSSPILAHNEYLQKNIKQKFLDDAIRLHNSMPDKGTSEYKRKLNELVDGVTSDPNIALINQSSAEYEKFINMSSQLMANGKYSNAAAKPYKEFTGLNPDGTLAKFQFMGLRPKKDVDGIINETVAKIPVNETSIDITTIEGKREAHSRKYKNAQTIYTGLKNRVLTDPELLADAMEQYNAADQKELEKILKIKAQNEVVNQTADVYGFEANLLNRQDRIAAEKAQVEQKPGAYEISKYDDNYNKTVLNKAEDYLDEKGNIKPASISAPHPWSSPAGEPGERAFRAGQALSGNDMYKKLSEQRNEYNRYSNTGLTSTTSAKERMEYSRKRLLEIPEFKAMVDNYIHAGLNQNDAIKKAGQELRNMPFASKKMEGRIISDPDEQKSLLPPIKGMAGALSFYDFNNPTGSAPKGLTEVLAETDGDFEDINIGAELAPVAGVSGDQNYLVTLGKGDKAKSYIVSMNSPYGNRKQSKMLFDAQRTRTALNLNKYYPELDDNLENYTLKQDAAKYGTDNVIIYTGVDGKLHLKKAK